jgi:hypothetical protein
MDSVMVSTILVNILIGCFALATLSRVMVGVETFIHDRKRDAEYHQKRMEQLEK